MRGSIVSREPDVQLAVCDLLAQVGLTKRRRAERLADMVESGDLSIVGRGLELSYRLDRSLTEQVEVNHNIIDARQALLLLESMGLLKRTADNPPIDITPA